MPLAVYFKKTDSQNNVGFGKFLNVFALISQQRISIKIKL